MLEEWEWHNEMIEKQLEKTMALETK